MITEDYVSVEIAKLLKEKGFNCRVTRSYFENDDCYAPCDPSEVQRKDVIRIPTLQMAMKWLREIHNITISISFDENNRICHVVRKDGNQIYSIDTPKSYEEVCKEDIKYCLKNLI